MINTFFLKRLFAFLIVGVFCSAGFYIGGLYYGLVGGLGFFALTLIVGYFVGTVLTRNPFSIMLEGKGILAFKLDSTGIMTPFIVNVMPPFMIAKLYGKKITDVFDRDAVVSLSEPIVNSRFAIPSNGGLKFELDERDFNNARFAMFHYPVILYNDQLKSVILKSQLDNLEKNTFAQHAVLYLNRQMESLTFAIRDFGRYIVETMKPKASIFGNKWFWIVLVIFAVIMIALFLPKIMNVAGGAVGGL